MREQQLGLTTGTKGLETTVTWVLPRLDPDVQEQLQVIQLPPAKPVTSPWVTQTRLFSQGCGRPRFSFAHRSRLGLVAFPLQSDSSPSTSQTQEDSSNPL